MREFFKNTPWQAVAFLCGMLFYALFSSPTPESMGTAEGFIAICFLLSLQPTNMLSRPFEAICLLCAIVIPTLTGFIIGNDVRDMSRDIVALSFFFLPLLYGERIAQTNIPFQKTLAACGVIFAIRTIIPYQDILMTPSLWGNGPPADLMYLANSPEVLFAGLTGVRLLFKELMEGAYQKMIVPLCLIFIPLLAMFLMMQRAGIAAMCFAGIFYAGRLLYVRPLQGLIFMCISALTLIPTFMMWAELFQSLWQKNRMVGENGRFAEWAAILRLMQAHFMSLFFGFGWGARFEDPAVGGLSVTYTHSLLSFLMLKTGGVGACVILLGVCAGALRGLEKGVNRLKWAIIADYLPVFLPLFISVFLYANYKSLGFGLILCIFWDNSIRKLEKNSRTVS